MSTTAKANEGPTNPLVTPMLTDLYQITMAYAYWKSGKVNEDSVFELFFRKNPFKGEFTLFCGLDEILKFLKVFRFTKDDIEYLKKTPALKNSDAGFFDYLLKLDTSALKVRALQEGSVVFPRIPMIILEGPLGLCQLIETTLLNLVNFSSLVATNATRMVLAAQKVACIEFGLRRAQGPDGGCSASKYSYVGGFVGTSNIQAGKMHGIPVIGTHAHAFVQAFTSLEDVEELELLNKESGNTEKFLPHVLKHRKSEATNDSELAAFISYACAFPDTCLCLADTYDTLRSGVPNFISVALALDDFGYKANGIRLDSGDLGELSVQCKKLFTDSDKETNRHNLFDNVKIVASDGINEKMLNKLSKTKHNITGYGIGTNLVTCQAQPALGCVYKLVECKGKARMKFSQDAIKILIPGRKTAYRLYEDDKPLLDYIALAEENMPEIGQPIICCNPFVKEDRKTCTPSKADCLQNIVFDKGECIKPTLSLVESRKYVKSQMENFPSEITDFTRESDPKNYLYSVMVSEKLYNFLHELWKAENEKNWSENQK